MAETQFPRMLHHPDGSRLIVRTAAEQERALNQGWTMHRAVEGVIPQTVPEVPEIPVVPEVPIKRPVGRPPKWMKRG